ncbi:MAG: outer membrane beta-barrel protein, partial [Myxococcales bacterium]|nr:outer membrane beta-barrel protein [Myxococcales bacterium]
LLLLTGLLAATPAFALEGVRSEAALQGRFELGPRLTHLRLRNEAGDELGLGGIGLYLRYRLSRRFGVEGTLDAVMADELAPEAPGEVERFATPMTLSVLFYFFPDSDLQVYLVAGGGTAAHQVDYDALGQRLTYESPLAQFGVGAQLRLEDIRLDLSLRSLAMVTARKSVTTQVIDASAGGATYGVRQPDDRLEGAMMTLGVNWGW